LSTLSQDTQVNEYFAFCAKARADWNLDHELGYAFPLESFFRLIVPFHGLISLTEQLS
jgi:hypothetical protein